MPKDERIKKVLVIGSGPIIIGQAAEFDYAGTQACKALREEGIEVILVNSNPATIMTDENMADQVYIEPLIPEVIRRIVAKEKPDSVLPTLGGQTGLNLAMELAEEGFWEKAGVRLLGTSANSIKMAEDRESFKLAMEAIDEPVIESVIAEDVSTATDFAALVGYPLIIRPAYTLGGSGGGIASDEESLIRIAGDGLRLSRVGQVLVEKSVSGWKEIEYEVMRDANGSCITVCNMENIDPVGVHTGDSIVIAPSQTLRDTEYQMLRTSAIKIINSLGIEGGCNVQYALDPYSLQYYLIEVNPRVSRSSALASKATGYPIARVAAKIAIGYHLDEITNGVTGKTCACFEPALDYVTVKIPRFPFDKFVHADKILGTRMKATGEVMAIGANFTEALLKAIRSLEQKVDSLELDSIRRLPDEEIVNGYLTQSHERLFFIAEALRRGVSVKEIVAKTRIDMYFVSKLWQIVQWEEELKKDALQDLSIDALQRLKHIGFADTAIARFTGATLNEVRARRINAGVIPTFKTVDTCAAEFAAESPYFYSTYQDENEAAYVPGRKVVVIGSGPIRIGQGIEFDYCCVHSVWALQQLGIRAIIVNNNPETVSTDFDTSDRLYFEPLAPGDVLNILDIERPEGVIVQFGGQTAIKLAKAIEEAGYQILGTNATDIHKAEDREQFDQLLELLQIQRPEGGYARTVVEAVEVADQLGYPVLIRPSYVLGGQGMEICRSQQDILDYMEIVTRDVLEHPVLIDKYIAGRELEVDAISDGEEILIPGIMEHIERAGIHSGDSISVYPARELSAKLTEEIVRIAKEMAQALSVKGLINIQFVEKDGQLYVIEVNPRSSRTVPYLSKVTGIPMVDLATRAILGETVTSFGFGTGLYPARPLYAIKVPVFSFEKLPDLEISLGPEMKSTGEVLGLDRDYTTAMLKGFTGAGIKWEVLKYIYFSAPDFERGEMLEVARLFVAAGCTLLAGSNTAAALVKNGIEAQPVMSFEGPDGFVSKVRNGGINLVVNIPTKGRNPLRAGFRLRRAATESSVPCLTSLDTARELAKCLAVYTQGMEPVSLSEMMLDPASVK